MGPRLAFRRRGGLCRPRTNRRRPIRWDVRRRARGRGRGRALRRWTGGGRGGRSGRGGGGADARAGVVAEGPALDRPGRRGAVARPRRAVGPRSARAWRSSTPSRRWGAGRPDRGRRPARRRSGRAARGTGRCRSTGSPPWSSASNPEPTGCGAQRTCTPSPKAVLSTTTVMPEASGHAPADPMGAGAGDAAGRVTGTIVARPPRRAAAMGRCQERIRRPGAGGGRGRAGPADAPPR